MKTIILILATALTLSGCGWIDRGALKPRVRPQRFASMVSCTTSSRVARRWRITGMDRLKFAEMLGNKMENLIESSKQFAMDRHKGQVRKYTGDPYFNHLQEVADIVSEYTDDPEMIAAAYLHDVLEDTETGGDELLHMFPISVYAIVWLLTDQSKPEDGNRAARKKIDRDHVLSGGRRVQIIKCADLISNTESITKHDPGFARVYLEEGRLLLEGMRDDVKSHPIWQRAVDQINKAR